jgi:Tol biopolymer transport system component
MEGRQIGPYTIVEPLGAGGMGEVYRARDTKLGRDVAIKILPSHFTADPERRARFAREARILATLNHPHIGAIYGLEESEGLTAIVLELVEGPTLAHRLEQGSLRIAEALRIARQVAEALEAAHEKGIVHRDLKPSNIVLQSVSPSGDSRAKVLDFGLAKSVEAELSPATVTQAVATADGRILGTPAYMSPEQARGEAVDKRTDIWAFGCVLFEMLAGQRPFGGTTVTDILARILEREPDWSSLPANTPSHIRTLLERCLRKDPRARLHDVADAIIEIDDAVRPASAMTSVVAPGVPWRSRTRSAWIVAGGLGAALCVMTVLYLGDARAGRGVSSSADLLEFTIAPPQAWAMASEMPAPGFEISPDGRHLVVVALSQGVPMLWVRPIATPAWRALPGTEHAYSPFWSPDNLSIGFFVQSQIKTVKLGGGTPFTVCKTPWAETSGAAWSRDGVIVFGGLGQIMRVHSTGGNLTPVSPSETGSLHRWPSFFPDGQHFLYIAQNTAAAKSRGIELRLGSLSSPAFQSLGPTSSHAVYAAGHLFSVRNGRLTAQPFDLAGRRLTGEAWALTEQTALVPPSMRGQFTVATASVTGVLAYSTIGRPMYDLTWRDRTGKTVGTEGEAGFYYNLDLSRDEGRIAVSRYWDSPDNGWGVDIWLIDRARAGMATRLTFDPSREHDPVWSPDGADVVFNSGRTGLFSLFRHSANGSGPDELLVKGEKGALFAPDWSPDGRVLLYTSGENDGGLWVLPLTSDRKPSKFYDTPFAEGDGVFSPDGHWVAYESNESGRNNVYVRPFPSGTDQFRISRDGGMAPIWRGDGQELFFLALDGTLMAAGVESARSFHATLPQPLFQTGLVEVISHSHPYVVLRNGRQFLMPVRRNPPGDAPISVVWNWPALRQ